MKKYFLLYALLFSVFYFSQENKFHIKSVSLGTGIFYINELYKQEGYQRQQSGFSIFLEATSSIDKHLFSVNYIAGSELAILGPASFDIQEINIMYGRNERVTGWFEIEGFIGVGNFRQRHHDEKYSKIALPIKANLIFFPKNLVNIGINGNYNYNSLNNNMSAHLLLKYSF